MGPLLFVSSCFMRRHKCLLPSLAPSALVTHPIPSHHYSHLMTHPPFPRDAFGSTPPSPAVLCSHTGIIKVANNGGSTSSPTYIPFPMVFSAHLHSPLSANDSG